MDVQTKEETPLADVVTALSAQAALTTRDRRPHGDDFPEKVGVGVRPNGQNTPTNLVTENERRHTHPRVAQVSVQIRAAEAARFDPDERFASLWLWLMTGLVTRVASWHSRGRDSGCACGNASQCPEPLPHSA